ncbi:ornithine cyclodeaminase family protein [Sediminicola luteus]|uniref:Ornithine cyclodeaminase n=1 Tax=Sediminicola luteus TaxID=319238 RepID=A0A2A4G7M9_9FLAO|nr:ornithine cyclodeaminase family protein [Sediminicola luteus]PCE64637.1 ornithine cyclodeaminase [Sediminicola luteus]
MEEIVQIPDTFIEAHTDFNSLVGALRNAFAQAEVMVPMRHHHDFPNPAVGSESTLLLMPAWNPSKEAGVKIVTVSPDNGQFDLPSIQGTYIYLDAVKGQVRALLEAKSLTAKRTAATSALASSYLSRPDASSMLMIGTGALSANLILAHAAVRPIKKVYVWGRSLEKAQAICNQLTHLDLELKAIEDRFSVMPEVDIIASATLSKEPLVLGEYLREGQHIDLVGAYRKDMRESDDACIEKATVFVDTYQGGLKESGDIVIPLREGKLKESDVKADLFGLCSGKHKGRSSASEITYFKSVGHALEDLTAAGYYFDKYTCQVSKT